MDPVWMIRLDPGDGAGPLLAVKDCIDMAGLPTSAGCQVVAELATPAAADAPVVANARAQGARIAGKTALTELCWSASGTNAWSGTPVNPAASGRVPGGSSSGSAVAVARGEADVAFGTDTGGSVRIPAACCGVVGLKTTWGRVPLTGVYPLAPSLDTVGPLGRDVAAVELGMRLIEPGFTAAATAPAAVGRLRLGVEVDRDTDAAVDRALAAAGLAVTDLPGPDLPLFGDETDLLIDYEAYRANEWLLPYRDRLTSFVTGALTTSAAVTSEQAAGARRRQDELKAWFDARFADYPVLALPTLAGPPPPLDAPRFSLTLLTKPANLAGLPAIAIPVPAALPASLQLIAPPGGEELLITLARTIEHSS